MKEELVEIWKDLLGYEGLYQISQYGKIKSFYGRKEFLRQFKDKNTGYYRVTLAKNGKNKACNIHRLLAINFIPNPTNLPYINHKNGIKTDNRLENLEWCDMSHNVKERYRLGCKVAWQGKDGLLHCSTEPIESKEIGIICSIKEAAAFLNISISYMRNMVQGNRKNWTTFEYQEKLQKEIDIL